MISKDIDFTMTRSDLPYGTLLIADFLAHAATNTLWWRCGVCLSKLIKIEAIYMQKYPLVTFAGLPSLGGWFCTPHRKWS